MQDNSRIVLPCPVKPSAERLRFTCAVSALVSKTEADRVADIRFHGFRNKICRISCGSHVIASERSFRDSPECVRVVQHIIRVFKIRIIEQGTVITELFCFLRCRDPTSVAAARRPSGHCKPALYDRSLSAGKILVPVLMLVRHACSIRSILLLRNVSRIIKDHKLVNAQILLVTELPVRHFKADIPRVVRNTKLVTCHILVVLRAGIHISLRNRGLPVLAVCTHRDTHPVL